MHRFLYHKIEDATYDTGFRYIFKWHSSWIPEWCKTRLVLPVIPSALIASIFSVFSICNGQICLCFYPVFRWHYCFSTWRFIIHHKVASPKNALIFGGGFTAFITSNMTVPLVLLHRFGILSSELCRKEQKKRLTLVGNCIGKPNLIDCPIELVVSVPRNIHSKIVYIPPQSFKTLIKLHVIHYC